ncbi:MAG: DUF2126 domain-containing protein [Maricaulaceae bacterium]
MSIRIGLTHITRYRYDRKVGLGPQVIRLRPAPHTRTPIVSFSQTIKPADHFLNWQQDPFGNFQARAVFSEKTDHFEVAIDIVADMIAINPFDFFLDEDAFHAPFRYDPETEADLAPYLAEDASGARYEDMARFTEALWRSGERNDLSTIDFLVELNQRVQSEIGYIVRMEPGVQTPEETLERAKGSCRDSAWLLVNLLRRVGVASRFVSGYLVQLTEDEPPLTGPKGPASDFTDLHAWAEAFVPGAGWIGLDATSGLFAGEGHIPLAATPAPGSAAPVSGGVDECEVEFDFHMAVTRLREPARISKPFTEAEWADVDAAGMAVEAKLQAMDVRLTQGGEPTFIANTDRDADEWTIAAVGPTNRRYADALTRRLMDRFAPGGLLTHGQAKWYPGEPLPRWAFAVTWRKDGAPLWSTPELIAGVGAPTPPPDGMAETFANELAQKLKLNPGFVQPAFEDPLGVISEEADLPSNLSPGDERLDDPAARSRLAQVLARGPARPTGFVLPLQPAQADGGHGASTRWQSEIWRTRRGRLCLISGDSPMGFRLPMKSLPFVAAINFPHVQDADPFAPRAALPPPRFQRPNDARRAPPEPFSVHDLRRRLDALRAEALDPQHPGLSGPPVRTALVVEPRDSHLNVFLPPVGYGEAFADLIAAVEETALRLGQPVRIEGYPAPIDPRFETLKVTPDPGVIEVNIHPSADWASLRDKTETLYTEAKLCGLDASGFMLDGRPAGSGGGAHVTLGGASAPDSPFLRRPDVLGSLIRFWQNHPSLSFMFSGLFIGPTSQAPRADEARSDLLYELELALEQLPGPEQTGFPPWLVDRVLRHLLVDVTGNTHRSEICIDKLYSPDGPTGRLGLVEFRAFEMPPHWRMNAAQQLVLRALIAWFWKQPYTQPLVEFGTALHDKYMLPDVLWADFGRALDQISAGSEVRIARDWFKAQYDFRFPRAGLIHHDGVEVELRNALEPWHVLGEEGLAGGVARFVDSSLERLQVKVAGDFEGSHLALACNGRLLPLHKTNARGEQVCGVRFRTWLPASCLHPTIPASGPLVFDLVDLSQGRAVAGCTYYAVHPGGRNYEFRPVNALDAEGRRRARFAPFGHTPGPFSAEPARIDPRCPYTLDLRR